MLLLTHIAIALGGLVAAGVAYLKPSSSKIIVSYGLLASTILSGVLLIVVAQASILHTCVSGLTFTAVMYVGIHAAKHKLAIESVQD